MAFPLLQAIILFCQLPLNCNKVTEEEALQQLSNTSFQAKVDWDHTLLNQNIAKNTIRKLKTKKSYRPLQKISPSPLLELRVFTF